MKVKNKTTGAVVEATKIDDNTYEVEGKKVPKADMTKTYEIVKSVPKPVAKKEPLVVDSVSEIGGDIGGLAGALAKCQGEFNAVKKGSQGHGYSYADIAAVLEASSVITSKYGVAIIQMNLSKVVDDALLIGVKTILAHSSGGYVSSEIYVPAIKTKMNSLVQMAGVNITYLRRYGIQSALGLATTDNDGSDK